MPISTCSELPLTNNSSCQEESFCSKILDILFFKSANVDNILKQVNPVRLCSKSLPLS
jgi:hypothetical protein